MAKNIGGYLLAGVGGAALAWAAATLLGDDAAEPRSALEPAAGQPAEPPPARAPAEPAQVVMPSSNETLPEAAPPAPAASTGRNPIVVNAPPASRGVVTDLPSRHDSEPDHARPADELLSASRISCDF